MNSPGLILAAGTRLERFSITRYIARAGSSITYLASDVGSGSPVILIEYLPAGAMERGPDGRFIADQETPAAAWASGVAHFLAGAARAATLNHAGLAQVSRWFKANGTAYRVLTCPGGETLAERIGTAGTLDARELVSRSLPLIEALEYLHGQDLCHLQVAPANILVPDAGGAVLLGMDPETATAPDTARPPPGPDLEAYAAPEQFEADGRTGPWSDIYQLAATLYHASCGAAPPGALARSAAVQRGEPDPLTIQQAMGDARQEQRELFLLMSRGLVLEPAERPQSVREWRARIARTTSAATEPGIAGPGLEPAESRRRLPRSMLFIVLAAILGIAYYLLLLHPGGERPAPDSEKSAWISPEEVERWRQALEANAVIGYSKFMQDFPQSVHIQQAREQIDLLEDRAWEAIVAEGTRAAFQAHLDNFPDGRHATEALARLEEFRQEEARLQREKEEQQRRDDAAWNIARSSGTIDALDVYLAAWPGGSHITEAHDLRQQLQAGVNDSASFKIASAENTIEAYREYLRNYPAGRHADAAQAAIESLTLRTGKTFRDCSDCPLMIVIPAGSFWQGSADSSPLALSIEKPRHRVVIGAPFAVSVYEITLAEWDVCVADRACETSPSDNGWGRGRQPVIMVSWIDAQQYAEWLSRKTGQAYTLPSESQWEYAARAGEESDWPGGDPALVCAYGNIAGEESGFAWRHTACADDAPFRTVPVGSYKANAFGLHDVIGNVAEWTLDCMNLSYLEAPSDGSAWSRGMCSSRMTRGGSWFTGPKESRLGARFNLKNGDRNDFTGFRLVRSVEKQ